MYSSGMGVVRLEPTDEHKVPYDLTPEEPETVLDELTVAANTADLQVSLGAPLEIDNLGDAYKLETLIKNAKKRRKSDDSAPRAITSINTAFAAKAFLDTYGKNLALDAAQTRAAITNKLFELANCGDPKYELKALELLGKHSDIGLFTERSEININYNDPAKLEEAIKERVKRLLNAEIIDVTPIDISEELGDPWADDEADGGAEEETEFIEEGPD